MSKNRYGFSTGALAKQDYQQALGWIQEHDLKSVELSALRLEELEPLIDHLDNLPFERFTYISFHAPSAFSVDREQYVLSLLQRVAQREWNIVVHPDVIYNPQQWVCLGSRLLIENMDRRKSTGKYVDELDALFKQLPEARLCLDVAHARQLDTSLTLLDKLVRSFSGRIAEVHISELDSHCRHRPLSGCSVWDYGQFADSLREVPAVIIESMLERPDAGLREQEVSMAMRAMKDT